MIIVSILVAILAGILLLPTISDLVSLVAVLFGAERRSERSGPVPAEPSFLFLVPAHDESGIIEACVSSLVGLDYPAHLKHVVVIADNCTDDTAERARRAGAQALERIDPDQPGKPRAIAWALEQLDLDAFDAVAIVDADSIAEADAARELAALAPWEGQAAQIYCGVENPDDSALTRMSNVFANARYVFLYPLKERAGVNVPLMGNGMVFGADILRTRGWDAFSICEDWEMYALLTIEGYPIVGNPKARILAQETRSLEQSGSQRKRWAAGKLTVLADALPGLLKSRRIGWRQKLDALGELTHVGPAVHLGLVALAAAIVVLVSAPWLDVLLALLALGIARTILVTALSIPLERRPLVTLRSFLFLPVYTVWRVGVQIASLGMVGDKPWVKTRRNA